MRTKPSRLLIILAALFVFVAWPAAFAHAQDMREDWDGDGIINSRDECPHKAGPIENGGCPKEEPVPAPGGDPVVDPPPDPDQEPDGGDLPAEPALLLPYLPEEGPCMVATLGMEGVNIRPQPGTAEGFIIDGGLDPKLLYPALLNFKTAEGAWWMLKQGGFVAGWVTRQGGDCLLLPAVQLGEGWMFNGHFNFGSDKMQDFHFLTMFDNTGEVKGVWFLGLGEDGKPGFVSPGEAVGFNPQPDPPGEDAGFDPQPDPPGEDAGFDPQPDPPGEDAGFDPQPDPPAFFLMLSAQEGNPPDDGAPSPDDAGIVINWMIGDGSVMPDDSALGLCDGSVMPGDGSVLPGDGSVVPGDGSVKPSWLLPALGDGSVLPVEVQFCDGSVKPLSLLPAVPGDGSVVPGDGSVTPSWLLPAMVFPDGGGEALGCVSMLGGPDTSPGALCTFSDGQSVALCDVTAEGAFCAYSSF